MLKAPLPTGQRIIHLKAGHLNLKNTRVTGPKKPGTWHISLPANVKIV